MQFVNIPKLSKIFGPFSIDEMHELLSIFKPAHQVDNLHPRLRPILDSNPKFLTKKLEAQLKATLQQMQQEQAEQHK